MAQEYCVLYGILAHEEAAKMQAKICKRKGVPVPVISFIPSSAKKKRVKKESKVVGDVAFSSEDLGKVV